MRIESEFKLGFRDVLIKPKRSTIKTRAEVQVQRQYTFKQVSLAGLECQSWQPTWTLLVP